MQKLLLTGIGITIIILSACKKDKSNEITSSIADSSITPLLNVSNGTYIQGIPPSVNQGGGLLLDSTPEVITTCRGGQIILHPDILGNGAIEGYYIHFDGANSYIKVDYGSLRPALLHRPATAGRPQVDTSGYLDSVVIMQLPDTISNGTYCLEYWAYGNNGLTSNVVNICVEVVDIGSADPGQWSGDWKLTAIKESSNSGYITDTSWNNDPADSNFVAYYLPYFWCVNGYLSYDSTAAGASPEPVPQYQWYKSTDLAISANGAWQYRGEEVDKTFNSLPGADSNTITCGNIPYTNSDLVFAQSGVWSYDSSNNQLIVSSKDSTSSLITIYKYPVTGKTASEFTIFDPSYGEYRQYTKQP